MKILMVGSGGLGGFYGARLLAAERDVTFLLRAASAKRMAADGLRMTSPAGDVTIAKPPIVTAEELRETFDLVILTCKAKDLEDGMKSFAPAMGTETAILPLLNGMAHMAKLDEQFGRGRVLGGACYISAARDADGTIRHMGQPDLLEFGDRDEPDGARAMAIEAALAGAKFAVTRMPNILQSMWEKWSLIATTAGITCLMRAAVGDIVEAGYDGMTMQLFAENTAIVAAEGFPVGDGLLRRADKMYHEKGSTFKASMLRDIEAGNPIEAQQIVGDLLEHGRKKGLVTPLLEVAFANLRCYEERRKRELA
jgi:2-dehydropantoate 2-reductase